MNGGVNEIPPKAIMRIAGEHLTFLYTAGCFATARASASDPFPLTPALSLRERENGRQRAGESEPSGMFERWRRWLPFPEGEGRGEGERGSRSPEGYTGFPVGPHKS